MCTQVDLPNDETLETIGDLARLVGGREKLVFVDRTPHQDNCCLCGVDVAETLMREGYWVRQTPFGYEVRTGNDL